MTLEESLKQVYEQHKDENLSGYKLWYEMLAIANKHAYELADKEISISSIKTKVLPDEYFLTRLPNFYGSMLLIFPSYTNSSGIEFLYKVPLGTVSKMAKKAFYKEIQGRDAVRTEAGLLICRKCKVEIKEGDRFCHHCGFLLNWDVQAIYKRNASQTNDNEYWSELQAEDEQEISDIKAGKDTDVEPENEDPKPKPSVSGKPSASVRKRGRPKGSKNIKKRSTTP